MQAIEATGTIDESGQLQLDRPLTGGKPQRVRVIVLLSDAEEHIDDQTWRTAAAKNPSFSFLYDEAEDIYSLEDGKPVTYEG